MKTIYIHIGNFKTGTTAIQSYCHKSRKLLLKRGIDYIESGRYKHTRKSHAALPLTLLKEKGRYTPAWFVSKKNSKLILNSIAQEINESQCKKILISSEEFYRIAGIPLHLSNDILQQIKRCFTPHKVKVIMYVKDPLEFLISWYNQANKAPRPVKRFSDFVYNINMSLVVPQSNSKLWRSHFGENSLIIEPYHLSGAEHIHRFFSIMGEKPDSSWKIKNSLVNTKRDVSTLELDRVAKTLASVSPHNQHKFLNSSVLSKPEDISKLKTKLNKINMSFIEFCITEKLNMKPKPLNYDAILNHEKLVNAMPSKKINMSRKIKAKVLASELASSIKNFLS